MKSGPGQLPQLQGYDGNDGLVVDRSAARKAGRPSFTLRATMSASGCDMGRGYDGRFVI